MPENKIPVVIGCLVTSGKYIGKRATVVACKDSNFNALPAEEIVENVQRLGDVEVYIDPNIMPDYEAVKKLLGENHIKVIGCLVKHFNLPVDDTEDEVVIKRKKQRKKRQHKSLNSLRVNKAVA